MGGLIGISSVILASFLSLGSCDSQDTKCGVPTTISILAFAVGIPTMAMSILYAYAYLGSRNKIVSLTGNVIRFIGYLGLYTGIVAAFWQLSHYAGILFLACSLISFFSYLLYTVQIARANSPHSSDRHDSTEPHHQ